MEDQVRVIDGGQVMVVDGGQVRVFVKVADGRPNMVVGGLSNYGR